MIAQTCNRNAGGKRQPEAIIYLGIPQNPASSLSVSQEQACAVALWNPAWSCTPGAQMQVPAPSISPCCRSSVPLLSSWNGRRKQPVLAHTTVEKDRLLAQGRWSILSLFANIWESHFSLCETVKTGRISPIKTSGVSTASLCLTMSYMDCPMHLWYDLLLHHSW